MEYNLGSLRSADFSGTGFSLWVVFEKAKIKTAQAAEKVTLNPSGVKTPEETRDFMSRLKPRPTNISGFFHSLFNP
jgi:hypothetical protein